MNRIQNVSMMSVDKIRIIVQQKRSTTGTAATIRRPISLKFTSCIAVAMVFVHVTIMIMLFIATEAFTNNNNSALIRQQSIQHQRKLVRNIQQCPPKGFQSLKNFNISSYVSARWYVIKQKPVIYSNEETFCSYAQYTIDTISNKNRPIYYCLFNNCNDDILISVTNRGLRESVTGEPNIAKISARCPNPTIDDTSKIQVSFPIPRCTNYWIVAAGTFDEAINGQYINNNYKPESHSNTYEWAIISGGSPNVRTKRNKCVAGRLGQYDVRGLWMFARIPIPSSDIVSNITQIAENLGLDTSVWRSVTHVGCVDY